MRLPVSIRPAGFSWVLEDADGEVVEQFSTMFCSSERAREEAEARRDEINGGLPQPVETPVDSPPL